MSKFKFFTLTPPAEEWNEEQGWKRNTDLCMDVKTILRNDKMTLTGKEYPGILRRDKSSHYTFLETVPKAPCKRNPHVFEGRYLTLTRRDDGSLRPNFRPLGLPRGFTVEEYATGVSNELRKALTGLVEETECE